MGRQTMKLYTVTDIANLCQVQPTVIQAHLEAGHLRGVNLGIETAEWRFLEDDVINFYNILRRDKKDTSSEKPATQSKKKLPAIFRLNIKPGAQPGVDPKTFCFERQVAGMGWPVNAPADADLDWESYRQLAAAAYPDGSWTPVITLHDIPVGGVIWTRSGYGKKDSTFWIGVVTGQWTYLNDSDARAADIVNIRPVIWHNVGGYGDVPSSIARAFTPTVIAAIKQEEAIDFTEVLSSQLIAQGVWPLG